MSGRCRKYKVIYADPPWRYKNKRTGGSGKSGASQQYLTMDTDDICALRVGDIADKDCVLFLWATTPLKWNAFRVMRAWGFDYKTMIYWRKIMSLGMGFWYRGQVEELLVGVHGKIRAFRYQKPNFIQAKALRHSQKPTEFRALIEHSAKGLQPRIELFARERVDGWDAWGNEIESDIMLAGMNQRLPMGDGG